MLATVFVFILTLILMVSLGIVFSLGKGASLIAGFNMLPEEEKEKYDVVALCQYMGKMMFTLSFCVVLWLISVVYDMDWLLYVGIALFTVITIFILIRVNTGNRFKKA